MPFLVLFSVNLCYHIVEGDHDWIEALKETFKPYKEKVRIIEAFASSQSFGKYIKLDDVLDGGIDLVKMDIEGSEKKALIGAKEHIKIFAQLEKWPYLCGTLKT